MRATLFSWLSNLRHSYWFIPSVMAVVAIVLASAMTAIDGAVGDEWLDSVSWLDPSKPEGARAVLSTVAGSMITVAGVTFSMTLLSISHTTSQVGPRLLDNFMGDRSNQVTLGVFIATFLYCLMVLRTVRSGDVPTGGEKAGADMAAAFVPNIAIAIALLLAVTSVGVLIFFIHHIPESIHITRIIANVGKEIDKEIELRFPQDIGVSDEEIEDANGREDLPSDFYDNATRIRSESSGYVQYIDSTGLMNAASEDDLIIRIRYRPGDFVTKGSVLLQAYANNGEAATSAERLKSNFALGIQRTAKQNVRFSINQLIEVSMRALSPGINDPFTACSCMDWLQAALENISLRELPSAYRYGPSAELRVIAKPEDFGSFASLVFDQLRPYVAADRNAAIHMMEMLARLIAACPLPGRRSKLLRYAELLYSNCKDKMNDQATLDELLARSKICSRLASDPGFQAELMETEQWFGGRA